MILDENLFQDYRKPLKESAEAVKRILQPRVTKYGIKPFGKNEMNIKAFLNGIDKGKKYVIN